MKEHTRGRYIFQVQIERPHAPPGAQNAAACCYAALTCTACRGYNADDACTFISFITGYRAVLPASESIEPDHLGDQLVHMLIFIDGIQTGLRNGFIFGQDQNYFRALCFDCVLIDFTVYQKYIYFVQFA
jgi:hypothetical protein